MLVKNEKFQDINLSSLVKEILSEDEQERLTVSKDQAEDALAQMYYQGNLIANQTVFKNQNYMMPEAKAMVATEGVKKWRIILQKSSQTSYR